MSASNANAAVPDDLDEMERKILVKNVVNDLDSDEDGGHKTRMEFDSDFSEDECDSHDGTLDYDNPDGLANLLHTTRVAVREEDRDLDDLKKSEVLNQDRKKGNTGAKGVLADYEEFKAIEKRRRETKALKRLEAFKATGATAMMNGGQSYSLSAAEAAKRLQQAKDEEGGREDDGHDEQEEMEDEVLTEFRANRLAQMRAVSNLPVYGRLINVRREDFVTHVDDCDPRTFVVVHVFEEYLSACRRMNDILTTLAGRHRHVKFLKFRATLADQSLSHSSLPAIMVYKNKQVWGEASIKTGEMDFSTNKFTEEDVEWLLVAKYKVVLPGVDVSRTEESAKAKEDRERDERLAREAAPTAAVGQWTEPQRDRAAAAASWRAQWKRKGQEDEDDW